MKNTLKKFFSSKINWMAIIGVLVSLQDFFKDYDFSSMNVNSWITLVTSILILIFRTWFNSGGSIIQKQDQPK